MSEYIIGIESSCDDTCFCVMDIGNGEIAFELNLHQDEVHKQYGGVMPNKASEAHLLNVEKLAKSVPQELLKNAVAVACTQGPGLIGSLLVGVSFAKGLASFLGIPLLRINHLEGHAVSCMIENKVEYPYLLLLASGGNSMTVLAKELGEYEIIGQTLDDAAGEALDKMARDLGIDYPGAINMEKIALTSTDKNAFIFKDGCINKNTFNFSFSGLKTQLMYKVKSLGGAQELSNNTRANLAYACQEAVFSTLIKKTEQAFLKNNETLATKTLVVCGGVSANERLSFLMQQLAEKHGLKLIVPSLKYTTDNAAMIAQAGCLYWKSQNK
ncbi:MAG: tRNA (adenosine(37)-N6)-threonylcarbamoyltransferase complex transferase subunit TsaD, partial [Rickettsiales bacterium]|nr:tRNA (adenosine(37)-N6)-threonylcarbamoyltransferase complex transferase subunit TsaD [Rickettsiales bacterium]